jgi:hypothetical protein
MFVACSIVAFHYAIAPALQWLLAHSILRGPAASHAAFGAYSFLYNALWLLPAYVVSLVVSNMWCGRSRSCWRCWCRKCVCEVHDCCVPCVT